MTGVQTCALPIWIPRSLQDLGLPASELHRHIAWDIGALGLARGMSEALDAPLIAQNYSRLVIDCNRDPRVPTSIPQISEWVVVPGNLDRSAAEIAARRVSGAVSVEEWLAVTPRATLDLLASFQRTVIDELLRRAVQSAEDMDAHSIIISGGVACNAGLQSAAKQRRLPGPVYFPTLGLATDNAAMIAAAAFPKLQRGEFAGYDLRAQANLALA